MENNTFIHTNRLIKEKSPYLLQHAHNPVDWFPWGREAFEKARNEDKPILLSVGYSTCHWCHVMEKESFEDPAIAQLMNRYFVPIKVDREERPDIDHVYMTAVTAITGQGGWPLTVFLTPDKKPFWGGSYFPPEARWGSPGLRDVLNSIHDAWQSKKEQILSSSHSLTDLLRQTPDVSHPEILSPQVFEQAYQQFLNHFDQTYGGFGQQPKFPSSHNLSFLLRYWKKTGSPEALHMVEKTLDEMSRGGMFDWVGGGFHRYSTDQQWQVPHFEKMLYDQAILARTYLEAYQVTKKKKYADIAREIFDYVLRDMRDPQGGFYSAQDADSYESQDRFSDDRHSEKREGAFYIWRYSEIEQLLEPQERNVFNYMFGVLADGNAFYDPHGEFVGKNILYQAKTDEETAQHFKISTAEIKAVILRCKEKFFLARNSRPRPHLDDKVLVDWNGLMISTLAFGARILNEERYAEAARGAVQFILQYLVDQNHRLLHRYRDRESGISGNLCDYAFFVHGLLDLYETTFDLSFLKEAIRLAQDMIRLFWDDQGGGFFFTAHDAEQLISRQKETYDGAIPSGNSIASLNLVRLFHLTLKEEWRQKAQKVFSVFFSSISKQASSYCQMLIALDFYFWPSAEIVLVGDQEDASVQKALGYLNSQFLPNKIVLLKPMNKARAAEIVSMIPSLSEQIAVENQATFYVCKNHVCHLPIQELEKLKKLLSKDGDSN